MEILIAYGSKYGCTKKCAEILSEKINGAIDLFNLKANDKVNLNKYDVVIIGGSIYAGKIRNEVKNFCINNLDLLKHKNKGVFICCMHDGEMAQKQLEDAFPKEIFDDVIAKGILGWELSYSKMGFFDRFIAKKVTKITNDTKNIMIDNINRFAEEINRHIRDYQR